MTAADGSIAALVERLRRTRANMLGTDDEKVFHAAHEAARAIERLVRERDEARMNEETLHSKHRGVCDTLLATEDERDAYYAGFQKLVKALHSIAENTCCDKCHEAALVARAALGFDTPDTQADAVTATSDAHPAHTAGRTTI